MDNNAGKVVIKHSVITGLIRCPPGQFLEEALLLLKIEY